MYKRYATDVQVPSRAESVANAQCTIRIPGRPDMFIMRYATINFWISGGEQMTYQESD